MTISNIFSSVPTNFDTEVFQDLFNHGNLRIERIISKGHISPESGWYDQDQNEWVIVLQGAGTIQFKDGSEITLNSGDYLNIPAHQKHKVVWTEPKAVTIWLAVFYPDNPK
ncbi:MAG: cupin domain-containing protein [Gammaproteobacteria bacterium]|nr:cupin domain-containing protein [Gammaproteobacteria bacterium]